MSQPYHSAGAARATSPTGPGSPGSTRDQSPDGDQLDIVAVMGIRDGGHP